MTYNSSSSNPAFQICFGIIWIGVCLTMGAFFTQFAEMWPSGGPGPSPSMLVWIPYAMSAFGVLMIVSAVWRLVNKNKAQPVYQEPTQSVVNPWAQKSSSWATSGYDEEEMIDIPDTCPHCQAALTDEGLEWVGPMSFKCPSCGNTVRAQRRKF